MPLMINFDRVAVVAPSSTSDAPSMLVGRTSARPGCTSALTEQIGAAFADNPILPRGSLVYRGSWETESLLRNLARVKDAPTDRFVEYHADSLPEFTPEGLRDRLAAFSLKHRDAICAFIKHLQDELAGEHYDSHFARALAVWGC